MLYFHPTDKQENTSESCLGFGLDFSLRIEFHSKAGSKERIWVWGNSLFTTVVSVALHRLYFQEPANFVQPQPPKDFATC